MFLRITVSLLCFAILYLPQAAYGKEPLSEKRRAEEAADKFIRRWHETLDLNLLSDDLYVSNPQLRQEKYRIFFGLKGGMAAYDLAKDVDEKIMRVALIAFLNLMFLKAEYALAFGELSLEAYEHDEEEESDLVPNMVTRVEVEKYIASSEQTCSQYRKHLTAEIFESALYKLNLRKAQESREEILKTFQIIKRDLSEYGGEPDVKVYLLKRGVFDFSFIEEGGELKVLKLG
jgi:hypothetical protein